MFLKRARQVLDGPLTDEYFTLAVLDKFLKVVGDGFGGTEVLHVLGNFNPHLLAEAEKVVDAVFAGHHHRLELVRADAGFPEFLLGDGLHVIERPPVDLDSIFLFYIIVGRSFWFGLGDQDGLHRSFWGCSRTSFDTVCTHSAAFNQHCHYQKNFERAQRGRISTAQRYIKKRNKLWAINPLAVSIHLNWRSK